MNTIESPLIIIGDGSAFKLNKSLPKTQTKLELVDKQVAVDLKNKTVENFLSDVIQLAIEKAKIKSGLVFDQLNFNSLLYNNGGDIVVGFRESVTETQAPLEFKVFIFRSQFEKLLQ